MESRVDVLEGRHSEALAKLSQVKRKYDSRPFPAQLDLAGAYLATGNYSEASQALAEILDEEGYDQDSKSDARCRLRDLTTDNAQCFSVEGLGVKADEGNAYYGKANFKTNWKNGARWQVWSRFDDLSINPEGSFIEKLDRQNVEGGLRYNKLATGLLWTASLGAAQDYATGGASVGSPDFKRFRWNLEGSVNELVTNSLQLQTVNARQHRISLAFESQVNQDWYFDITGFGRYVHLDGTEFGTGLGTEYST
jgi:hypothetical protein